MDLDLQKPAPRAEPFLLVRVEGSLLALPVAVIAPPDSQGQNARLDLGSLCGLCAAPKTRASSISVQSGAGPIPLAIDASEDLVHCQGLDPLPALTALRPQRLVRGLVRSPRGAPPFAAVLDGVLLGEWIAQQILQEDD